MDGQWIPGSSRGSPPIVRGFSLLSVRRGVILPSFAALWSSFRPPRIAFQLLLVNSLRPHTGRMYGSQMRTDRSSSRQLASHLTLNFLRFLAVEPPAMARASRLRLSALDSALALSVPVCVLLTPPRRFFSTHLHQSLFRQSTAAPFSIGSVCSQTNLFGGPSPLMATAVGSIRACSTIPS